jgi:hypothetical protein
METASHEAKPERERYERIVAGATEIVQTLISLADGGPTPLDLVVEKVTALLDDSVALAPHSLQALRLRVQLADVKLATAPTHGPGHQLATIDFQAAKTKSHLADANSNARQLCKALAATGDRPDPSLLHAITAALRQISNDSQTLEQLGYDRTRITSGLTDLPHVDSTVDDSRVVGPVGRTTREALASPGSVTSFVSPPAPASRDVDDQLRRGPRIAGPTGL